VKDENVDLLADSQSILNRWKVYFSQVLNVHNVSNVGQIEVHTAEPFTTRGIKLTVIIIVVYHYYQLHTKLYRISSQG
jgi:hypothetical protein